MIQSKSFPRFVGIRLRPVGERIDKIEQTVARQMQDVQVARGSRIAIAVGSRGIGSIHVIVRTLVQVLKDKGCEPFIVPAMGSHGGGTAESQEEILEGFRISEEHCGAAVCSQTDTHEVTTLFDELPVQVDRLAWEADGIILVNRIKAHTLFTGSIGSGLQKMTAIGLGNPAGASAYHKVGRVRGMEEVITAAAAEVFKTGKVLGGLAIVENSRHEPGRIEWVPVSTIAEREPHLLALANSWQAKIPFDFVNGLIVDEIGKEIAGTGMDPNVIGRRAVGGCIERIPPCHIEGIYVRTITPKSAGNGTGIGLADMAHKRIALQIDWQVTRMNTFTAMNPANGRLPTIFESDREALDFMPMLFSTMDAGQHRYVWIRNTLALEEMWVSENMADTCKSNPAIEAVGKPIDLQFGPTQNLIRPAGF